MNMTLRVIIDILLGLGAFFTFVGVMGVVRMPDVFGRLQASTCIGSLGNIFLRWAVSSTPSVPIRLRRGLM